MSKKSYKHLFGPVHSRRLGISLGVDVVTFKTCSLDCIYCECGATTRHTLQRDEYVSIESIIDELKDYLCSNPHLDVVTFAGSGEPTLNSGLGDLIKYVKNNYPQYAIAVLTNSSLLHLPQVRQELLPADYILPSLDAVSEDVFHTINNPPDKLTARELVNGLITFSHEYSGNLWVEVFIAEGINDTEEELDLIRENLLRMNLTRVQLNSLDRPGTCSWIQPVSPQKLEQIAKRFQPLPVEIIARSIKNIPVRTTDELDTARVVASLARRPATVEELASALGASINEIARFLISLEKQGKISKHTIDTRIVYRLEKDH
ncbi:MAG: radical SAM protein [Chitinivibrionales bacterium]